MDLAPDCFWGWFDEERQRRRLSMRAIEALSGTRTNWLQRRRKEGAFPNYEGCRLIADAFGVPLETVLRKASLLPDSAARPDMQRVVDAAARLSDDRLAALAVVAESMAQAEASLGEGYLRAPNGPGQRPSYADYLAYVRALSPDERETFLADLEDLGREAD